jgi:hypothetical protein
MVHKSREEVKLPLPKPVGEPMHSEREDPRIEQNVPAGARRRIARFDGVEIGEQAGLQPFVSLAVTLSI